MASTATRSPARPNRSNSLQRMLELEQECMRDRRMHMERGQTSLESHGIPVSLQIPPIDTGTSTLNPAHMFATIHSRQNSDQDQQKTLASAQGSPRRVSSSTAENAVVDDRNELCQSPSWEAYDRRRKEKKEREVADRETTRAHRRKLSKAPPSPSTALVEKAGQTQTGACMSQTSPVSRPQPRQQDATSERPSSVAGLAPPNMPAALDSARPRGRSSRSSSISSLFRAPFEARRASVDTDNRDGFIGGLKLEQHRVAAHQKILEDQAAEIRKTMQKNRKRSESPLRFLVPRSEPKETRAYPPIALHTTGNQTLIPQDDGMMRKWKTRMGLRSRSREPLTNDGQKLAKLPVAQRPPISAPVVRSSSTPDVSSNAVRLPSSKSTPTVFQRIHGPVDDEKMDMLAVDPARHPIFDEGGPGSASERSSTTVPESPPAPPRRSSRRRSTVNAGDLENPVPMVSSQTLPATKSSTEGEERPERWTVSDPPSSPYQSVNPSMESLSASHQQRRTFKEAARAAFSAHTALTPPVMPAAAAYRPGSRSRSPSTTRTLRNTDERVLPADKYNRLRGSTFSKNGHVPAIQDWRTSCATAPPTPPYHSPEDSAWDGFRAPGEHGTSDTSRPQSVRSMFPSFGDERKKGRQFPILPSPAFSFDESRQSMQSSPLELDPIQAAAIKVMAAFPDSNAYKSQKPRRAGDEQQELARINTAVAKDQDPASKSPPLRELLMARDETSVVVPWPATYLEAARKAAPSAQAPLAQAPPAQAPPAQTPLKSSPTAAPQPLPIPREPIAKMFVECCECKYFHDMPSKLYKAMANPDGVVALGDEVRDEGTGPMTVKCPWCTHEMSTKCCAGLAAMVHVKERLH